MAYTTNKYKFQGKPLNSYLTSGTNYPYSTTYFKDIHGYVIQGKSVSASTSAFKITDYFNYTGRYPNPTYYEIADAWKYWPSEDNLAATLTNDTICAASTSSRRDQPIPDGVTYKLRRTGTNYYRLYDEDGNQVTAFSWSGYRIIVEVQAAGGGGGAGYGWGTDYATGGGGGAGGFMVGYLDLTPLINNSNSYYTFFCGERGGGMYDYEQATLWYLRGQRGGNYEINLYDASTQKTIDIARAYGGAGGSNAWWNNGGQGTGGGGTGTKDTDGIGGEGGGYYSPTSSAYWTNIPVIDDSGNVVSTTGHTGADGGHRPYTYYTIPEWNSAKGYPTPGYPKLWISTTLAGNPWGYGYQLNTAAIPEKGRGTGGASPTKIGGTMESVAGGKPGSEGSGGGGGDAFLIGGGGDGGAGGAGYFKLYYGDPRS